MNRAPGLVTAALLVIATVGCDGGAPAPLANRTLRVAAASSLRPVVAELAESFARENPGVTVAASHGASGSLFAQISNGAPFDVFLSADTLYPAKVAESGLALDGAWTPFAAGRLVLWVATATGIDPAEAGARALTDRRVMRVAIADPAIAPYGRAAEAALAALGQSDAVRPKLVMGDNVEQAAHLARSGAAEAAFLPLSLAQSAAMQERGRWWAVPASATPRVEHGAVILASAAYPELSRVFVKHLTGPAGRATLGRHGFLPAEP